MAEYKLTNKAVEDLAQIWEYTVEKWSGNQADIYYEALLLGCGEIAKNPGLGINYEGIANYLLGMKTNRHVIFYRTINENYVEITRILHEQMDLKRRVGE